MRTTLWAELKIYTVISAEERGMISIALPRFKKFIRMTSDKLD